MGSCHNVLAAYEAGLEDAAALAEKLAGTYHCVNAGTVAEAIRALK